MTGPNYREKYDTLYSDVKKFYLDSASKKFTVSSVIPMTRYAMEIIQTGQNWSTMKGSEKKRLVTEIIQEVVTDLINDPEVVKDLDENSKQLILLSLETVPFFIDSACDFAKVIKTQVKERFKSSDDTKATLPDRDVAKSGCFCG